jgi:hypothetical protein
MAGLALVEDLGAVGSIAFGKGWRGNGKQDGESGNSGSGHFLRFPLWSFALRRAQRNWISFGAARDTEIPLPQFRNWTYSL